MGEGGEGWPRAICRMGMRWEFLLVFLVIAMGNGGEKERFTVARVIVAMMVYRIVKVVGLECLSWAGIGQFCWVVACEVCVPQDGPVGWI